jgi:hypothetical protein
MEKNWIEKIKEVIHLAIDKKLKIYSNTYFDITYYFNISFEESSYVILDINCKGNKIHIETPKGSCSIDYNFSDRDKLELQILYVLVKEYRENMAISEFEEFISNKPSRPIDVNDLDDKEDE